MALSIFSYLLIDGLGLLKGARVPDWLNWKLTFHERNLRAQYEQGLDVLTLVFLFLSPSIFV